MGGLQGNETLYLDITIPIFDEVYVLQHAESQTHVELAAQTGDRPLQDVYHTDWRYAAVCQHW